VTTTQADLRAAAPLSTRRPHTFKRHDHLLEAGPRVGVRDGWPIDQILGLFPSLPNWPDETRYQNWGYYRKRRMITDGGRAVLEWLLTHPGAGWQGRWLASGADNNLDWAATVPVTAGAPDLVPREEVISGLGSLLLCRVVAPSYEFQAHYRAFRLFTYARQVFRPDLFNAMKAAAAAQGVEGRALTGALTIICKIVMHTGRDADQLTADDLLAYRAWCLQRHETTSFVSLAWKLLGGIADLGEYHRLKDALRYGQRPTAELVDAHRIQGKPVRDMLVRYFEERRPSLDYSSLTGLVHTLAGTFWSDIERHHAGIDTLRLPADVATAWKQRVRILTRRDGTTRPLVISKIMLHTGKTVAEIMPDDLVVYHRAAWVMRGKVDGVEYAWDLLAAFGGFPEGIPSFRGHVRQGPMSVTEMVEFYQVECEPVREMLRRYLADRAPELAHVLARIKRRVRGGSDSVQLVTRYDPYERVLSPPLPFLFQRIHGTQRRVIAIGHLASIINNAIARAGITGTDGEPISLTPHDFRRVFATEAVSGGLPVHIVAKLLGHESLTTTEAYTAIYPEDVVRH
jgi:hypothetical protein